MSGTVAGGPGCWPPAAQLIGEQIEQPPQGVLNSEKRIERDTQGVRIYSRAAH